jgi:type I restriction enzyme S subunit
MSAVNFLEKLLDGFDVEWTVLGNERLVEVANSARRPVKASLRVSGDTPYYGANNIQDFVGGHTHDGEYVLIAEDGSASLESYSIQYVTGKFWANNHVHVVRGAGGLNTKFLFHYLRTVDFIPFLPNKDRSKLTKGEMVKIPLPIPCPDNPKKSLEIQAEIVRILDAFTELTAELKAELTAELIARKKQYNVYRDQLLNFEDGTVEWKVLGGLTTIKSGQSVNRQMIAADPGEYAVINSGKEPLGYINVWNTVDDPIGITSRGAGVGSITWREGKYFRGNLNYSVTSKNKKELTIRYLYHVLQKMQMEIQALCTFDGIPALNAGNLKELQVPVPPLAVQERIASTLDKFDALTNSLTESLPREIELRQKQYEHYRNLLLSFPKLDVTEVA